MEIQPEWTQEQGEERVEVEGRRAGPLKNQKKRQLEKALAYIMARMRKTRER